MRHVSISIVAACLAAAMACDDSPATRDGAPPRDATSADGPLHDAALHDAVLKDAPSSVDGPTPKDLVPADADPTLSAFEKKLVQLPANSWYQAPSTKMRPVCAPASFGVNGVMGCSAVIKAWCGGTWDPFHRKLLVWGGGHNDYWGNEVYAFDVKSGAWKRLTDPSAGPHNKDPLSDGNPVSRHTYDGLAFITHAKRFFGHGGSRAKDGSGTKLTWAFDVDKLSWTNMKPAVAGPGGYSLTATYDPSTKQVLVRANNNLSVYSYDTNTWTTLKGFGFKPLWPRYEVWGDKSSTIDSKRGVFWSVGSGDILVWDIKAKSLVTDSWKTTGGGAYTNAARVKNDPAQLFVSGGGAVYDAKAPGLDYDVKADQLVAWKGGAPYVLDLATKTWSKGSGTGAPTKQAANGTFGRFAYLSAYNVFILVNDVDQDVYFYKNTAGGL